MINNDKVIGLDKRHLSLQTLLDLSLAQSTIDHNILLNSLICLHQISGKFLSWFRSHLSNRRQSVVIANHISPTKELHYGVPQGYVCGPILFVLYIQPLSNIIKRRSLRVHLFADDIQFEASILPQYIHSAISSVETCISDFKNWMIENKLQLSDEKTECLQIRPNKCTHNLNCTSTSIGHNVMSFSTTEINLGLYLRDDMRIDAHVQDICRKAYIDMRRISSIRHLSIDATKTPLTAFVLPKLDYYNSLLHGSPLYMLERHQKVQISAVRLIFQCRKQSHISLFMSLHWLPINTCIEYKLSVICHSFFSRLSPTYLSDLLSVYTFKGNLRSFSDNRILCIPKLRTKTFRLRMFYSAGPTTWNSLPTELRYTDYIHKFKSALKTHLHRKFYTSSITFC